MDAHPYTKSVHPHRRSRQQKVYSNILKMGRTNPQRQPIHSYCTRLSFPWPVSLFHGSSTSRAFDESVTPAPQRAEADSEPIESLLRIPPYEMKLFDFIDFISYIFDRK